jgi:PAS domain S-box-containing protein
MSLKSRAPGLVSDRENPGDPGDPFTAAFLATRMPMLITDPREPDNPILFANDAFLDFTGYRRDEVVGRNCRFLQGPDTDPGTLALIRARIAAGEAVETEILNYKKDGSPFWNSLVISPIRNGAGDLLYFFSSQFDVSAKKQAEMELTRAKTALEEEVSRRTRDLQAALDQKIALLHEVDHRVKNNLQVISSLLNIQVSAETSLEARKGLTESQHRIQSMALVHQLLYQSKDLAQIDADEYLTKLTTRLVEGYNIAPERIRVYVFSSPLQLDIDRAIPCGLIVNELVTNALTHAFPDERRGQIWVALEQHGSDVSLTVSDDGVGLPDTVDIDHALTFGLRITATLAKQLDGTIRVDRGHGTAVHVDFPLEKQRVSHAA